MKELLKLTSDFKIIPNNFKSSSTFKLIDVSDNRIKINLDAKKEELSDYNLNENVEVFGVNNSGLIYFETKIIAKEGNILALAYTNDYSLIQRREYSRVELEQGKILFKDRADDFVLKVNDISAGGVKFICNSPLEINNDYAIEIHLSNNMKIECEVEPIRVVETKYENKDAYLVSGKFVNLENVDRIVLVQYAFKIKMEEQNQNK